MRQTKGKNGTALFSDDMTRRYKLTRAWSDDPWVLFIGLNPSTADADVNDPTVRRCIGFAQHWTYGGLNMGNVFAYRATDPKELDAVYPLMLWEAENFDNLARMAQDSALVVAAWGANKLVTNHLVDNLMAVIFEYHNFVYCLGTNKDGSPRHPLYLRSDTPLDIFRTSQVAA